MREPLTNDDAGEKDGFGATESVQKPKKSLREMPNPLRKLKTAKFGFSEGNDINDLTKH